MKKYQILPFIKYTIVEYALIDYMLDIDNIYDLISLRIFSIMKHNNQLRATISIPRNLSDDHKKYIKLNVKKEHKNFRFVFQKSECDSPSVKSISDKCEDLGTVNDSHTAAVYAHWSSIQGSVIYHFRNFPEK